MNIDFRHSITVRISDTCVISEILSRFQMAFVSENWTHKSLDFKGFWFQISQIIPHTIVLCIVHQVSTSIKLTCIPTVKHITSRVSAYWVYCTVLSWKCFSKEVTWTGFFQKVDPPVKNVSQKCLKRAS